MLLFVFVVVVQYQISSVSLMGRPNRDGGSGLSYAEPAAALREELLRAAVGRLRLDDTISVTIDQKLLRDLMMQLGRELLGVGACGEASVPTAADPSLSKVPLTSQKTPRLYIITPTYRRPEQIAELTRMAQTLMHVQNLHWLVIEDAENKTQLVSDLLQRTGISHDHLVGKCACEHFVYEWRLWVTCIIPFTDKQNRLLDKDQVWSYCKEPFDCYVNGSCRNNNPLTLLLLSLVLRAVKELVGCFIKS